MCCYERALSNKILQNLLMVKTFCFSTSPLLMWFATFFANMDPGYHLHPVVRKNMRGERIYAGLETAEWWHRTQVRIATLSSFWSYLYMFY